MKKKTINGVGGGKDRPKDTTFLQETQFTNKSPCKWESEAGRGSYINQTLLTKDIQDHFTMIKGLNQQDKSQQI